MGGVGGERERVALVAARVSTSGLPRQRMQRSIGD